MIKKLIDKILKNKPAPPAPPRETGFCWYAIVMQYYTSIRVIDREQRERGNYTVWTN